MFSHIGKWGMAALALFWGIAPLTAAAQDAPRLELKGLQLVPQPPADQKGEQPKVTDEQIAGWIKQLEHESAEKRDEATRNLKTAGKAAIEKLGTAAESKNAEVSRRSVEVLKHLFSSTKESKETRDLAEKTLKKLSESKNEALAKRADDALKGKGEPGANGLTEEQMEALKAQLMDQLRQQFNLPDGGGDFDFQFQFEEDSED